MDLLKQLTETEAKLAKGQLDLLGKELRIIGELNKLGPAEPDRRSEEFNDGKNPVSENIKSLDAERRKVIALRRKQRGELVAARVLLAKAKSILKPAKKKVAAGTEE